MVELALTFGTLFDSLAQCILPAAADAAFLD